jgi:hypothetical protein
LTTIRYGHYNKVPTGIWTIEKSMPNFKKRR